MTKLKVPFYVSTNNKHLECLEVFIHIFNHFIPEQELRILGYGKPSYELPDNCKFISKDDHRKNSKRTDLKKGDILFSRIGTVGETRLVDSDKEFI